jgi:hypothetical protein
MMRSTEPERKAGRGNDVEGKLRKNNHVFSAAHAWDSPLKFQLKNSSV